MTRYKLTTLALLFLALMSMAALLEGMEALSVTCITGMMTTLSAYIWGQTKRPSGAVNPEKELEQNKEQENEE